MRKGWMLGGLAALVAVVLTYAWVDGGREPVRPIVQDFTVSGGAR